MQVDIIIDKLTDCLLDRRKNTIVETEYKRLDTPIKKKDYSGWKFDWSKTQEDEYTIYELFVKGSSEVEGRISLRIDGGVALVDIVESNPHNVGHLGKYIGVGGHLFAIACLVSLENGCDGYVGFVAKSNLIDHYINAIGAKVISGQRMAIDEYAAQELIETYLER